jgi:hypothetical protein
MSANHQITAELRLKTILNEADADLKKFSAATKNMW